MARCSEPRKHIVDELQEEIVELGDRGDETDQVFNVLPGERVHGVS